MSQQNHALDVRLQNNPLLLRKAMIAATALAISGAPIYAWPGQKEKKVKDQTRRYDKSRQVSMEQFQEYEGNQVIVIWNVTGQKSKDKMKSIPVPSSEFRDSPMITYPFCTRMFRAFPPGNVRRPFPNDYAFSKCLRCHCSV